MRFALTFHKSVQWSELKLKDIEKLCGDFAKNNLAKHNSVIRHLKKESIYTKHYNELEESYYEQEEYLYEEGLSSSISSSSSTISNVIEKEFQSVQLSSLSSSSTIPTVIDKEDRRSVQSVQFSNYLNESTAESPIYSRSFRSTNPTISTCFVSRIHIQ